VDVVVGPSLVLVVGNMVVVGAGVVHSGGAWSNVRHAGLPLHELSYP